MDHHTWVLLEQGFNRWPESEASPVEPGEFDDVMGPYAPVEPDYRAFVLRYGGGIVGSSPIYGLRKAGWTGTISGNSTAPTVTEWFREKKWSGVEGWLIFSVDQGGNPIGLAADGAVWLSDQLDFKQVVQLAGGVRGLPAHVVPQGPATTEFGIKIRM
jgi:hypothetical protein